MRGSTDRPPIRAGYKSEYCEYAASAVYIIHVFYLNDVLSEQFTHLCRPKRREPLLRAKLSLEFLLLQSCFSSQVLLLLQWLCFALVACSSRPSHQIRKKIWTRRPPMRPLPGQTVSKSARQPQPAGWPSPTAGPQSSVVLLKAPPLLASHSMLACEYIRSN
eukprot:COSAG02_NODE_15513_length_1164_cov_1.096714_2_plen_162_part_00